MANEDAEQLANEGLDKPEPETLADDGTRAAKDVPEGFAPPPDDPSVIQQVGGPQPETLETECAFIVFLDAEGHWMANNVMPIPPINAKRQANFNDFYNAACTLQKDIQTSEAANRTVMLQQMAAQQVAQQIETARIAQQMGGPVGQGLDLSKLRSPGQ